MISTKAINDTWNLEINCLQITRHYENIFRHMVISNLFAEKEAVERDFWTTLS